MSQDSYVKEINRITDELNILDPDKKGLARKTGFLKYKDYLIIIFSSFLFLYIVKPKIILKIATTKTSGYQYITISFSKFMLWWLVLSVVVSLVYFIYQRKR